MSLWILDDFGDYQLQPISPPAKVEDPPTADRGVADMAGKTCDFSAAERSELAWILPSGYVNIAIENGHRNSEFSHEKWWIFP